MICSDCKRPIDMKAGGFAEITGTCPKCGASIRRARNKIPRKWWFYGIGLVSLPFFYIGAQLATGKPIEWMGLLMMAVILAPILLVVLCRKSMEADLERFRTQSTGEKLETVGDVTKMIVKGISRHGLG